MSRRTMVLATILMGLSGAKGFAQPGARSPGPDRANATTQGEKAPARPGADASQHNASDLDRFFGPPAEYASDFGSYRSPLEFYDGRPVKNAEDWPARRREILDRWHTIMGPWPPLVEKPAIEYLAEERRDNFTQHHVRLQIAPDRFTDDAYLLKPDGDGPFPAVVVVYYESLTGIGRGKSPLRDFAYQLARRGFVTLSLGSPPSTFYPGERDAQLQPLSFHAYVAANCWQTLAHLPSVDAQRIGIVGHSYGGKWAMFASCLFDKFACAAWSDGGIVFDEKRGNVNYWEPWYLGHEPGKAPRPKGIPSNDKPRTGAYKMLVEQRRDLHELHALMAPRPFLVSGGAEDTPARWQALNHAVAVNKLLGHSNRVAMTNRQGHAPTPESNEQIYLFFEQCLKKSSGGDAQRSARTGDDAERQTFTYKTVGELPILADVYRLPGDDVRPVIVWIHGGGLITGSRGGPRLDQRRRYLDAGYAIVSIDYRLAPETKAAGIVQDVQDAIAWVRTQGPQLFQIDPRRLAVVGHSAGGYLTLMSGFTVKPPPQALIAFYGYGDVDGDWYAKPHEIYRKTRPLFTKEEAHVAIGVKETTAGGVKGRSNFYTYCRQNGLWPLEVVGFDPATQPREFDRFCPVRNVTKDYPPTLLLHGDQDIDVPHDQSVAMAAELKRVGVPHEFLSIQGGGHGFDGKGLNDLDVSAVFDKIEKFLEQHVGSGD